MNTKTIFGIILIVLGIAISVFPILPFPNVRGCALIGPSGGFDIGCVLINGIPVLMIIIVGIILVYLGKGRLQKKK